MFDFITIGGATRDILLKVNGAMKKGGTKALDNDFLLLPYGEKLVSEETFYSYGGGAINTATCLARLGLKVAPVCNIGAEGTGSLVVKKLKQEGINTSLVTRDKKHHTGLSVFVLGSDNEHTGFLERGANNYLSFSSGYLRQAKWFYVSSLTGESANLLPIIFDYARKHKIKIAFNPGSEQLAMGCKKLSWYIERSEIVSINLEEAEILLAEKRKKYKNKRNLCMAVADLGAKITLITDGENGSHAVIEGKLYSQAAMPKTVMDTTGAGDSFGATFAFAIYRSFDVRYALRVAAINSASVVSRLGATDGLLKYRQIKECYGDS